MPELAGNPPTAFAILSTSSPTSVVWVIISILCLAIESLSFNQQVNFIYSCFFCSCTVLSHFHSSAAVLPEITTCNRLNSIAVDMSNIRFAILSSHSFFFQSSPTECRVEPFTISLNPSAV